MDEHKEEKEEDEEEEEKNVYLEKGPLGTPVVIPLPHYLIGGSQLACLDISDRYSLIGMPRSSG